MANAIYFSAVGRLAAESISAPTVSSVLRLRPLRGFSSSQRSSGKASGKAFAKTATNLLPAKLPAANHQRAAPAELLRSAEQLAGALEVCGRIDVKKNFIALSADSAGEAWLRATRRQLGFTGVLLRGERPSSQRILAFHGWAQLKALLPLLAIQLRCPTLRSALEQLAKKQRLKLPAAAAEPSEDWFWGAVAAGLQLSRLRGGIRFDRRDFSMEMRVSSQEAALLLQGCFGAEAGSTTSTEDGQFEWKAESWTTCVPLLQQLTPTPPGGFPVRCGRWSLLPQLHSSALPAAAKAAAKSAKIPWESPPTSSP